MKKTTRKNKIFKSIFAMALAVTMFLTSALPAQANVESTYQNGMVASTGAQSQLPV